MKKAFLACAMMALSLTLGGCASRVTPETSMRVYEQVDDSKLLAALPKAFTQAGYVIAEAKTEKTSVSVVRDGVKKEGNSYDYGPVKLPRNGSLDCMKLASAKIVPNEKFQLIELRSVDVTCYNSIGKMHIAIDTDKKTYESFFSALDQVLGKEGKRLGAKP